MVRLAYAARKDERFRTGFLSAFDKCRSVLLVRPNQCLMSRSRQEHLNLASDHFDLEGKFP